MDENVIVRLEHKGIVTDTFRKLTPKKKEKIYQTALTAFATDVFERVSLDSVADNAGVSKGSLFQYFENKANLLKFAGAIFADEYRRFIIDYANRETTVRVTDRIKKYFLIQSEYWLDNQVEFDFFMKLSFENGAELSSEFTETISQLHVDFLAKVLSRGIQTGELRSDLDATQVATALSLLFDGILKYYSVSLTTQKRKRYLEIYIDRLVGLLFDGIRA